MNRTFRLLLLASTASSIARDCVLWTEAQARQSPSSALPEERNDLSAPRREFLAGIDATACARVAWGFMMVKLPFPLAWLAIAHHDVTAPAHGLAMAAVVYVREVAIAELRFVAPLLFL